MADDLARALDFLDAQEREKWPRSDSRATEYVRAHIAKLEAFKAYVHARLDVAGIPSHPDKHHSAEGCRVGDRLDIAFAVIEPAARVYRGLSARIDDAPEDAVPVFDGIAELHDALGVIGTATENEPEGR